MRECDADGKFNIKEFWDQFNTNMKLVTHFPFYAFLIYAAVRRYVTAVYNDSQHCLMLTAHCHLVLS
jgi:FMN-dependent NADH-azoreductase